MNKTKRNLTVTTPEKRRNMNLLQSKHQPAGGKRGPANFILGNVVQELRAT